MATQSSILAWRTPWTEKSGELLSIYVSRKEPKECFESPRRGDGTIMFSL